jgi:hypothetical protein
METIFTNPNVRLSYDGDQKILYFDYHGVVIIENGIEGVKKK